jgi:hypothetical protein
MFAIFVACDYCEHLLCSFNSHIHLSLKDSSEFLRVYIRELVEAFACEHTDGADDADDEDRRFMAGVWDARVKQRVLHHWQTKTIFHKLESFTIP